MESYIGVSALVLITSMLSTLLFLVGYIKRFHKENDVIRTYFIQVFSFFIFIFFFILSSVKYYLGYKKESIFESFWDIQGITYFHYAIPMILIGIVGVLFLIFLLGKISLKLVTYFNSSMVLMLFGTFFAVRKMNNRAYCIAFILSLIITLLSINYINKHELRFVRDSQRSKKIKKVLIVLVYWIVTIAIYIPNELYLNNAEDFPMSYWYFFGEIILMSAIIIVLSLVLIVAYMTDFHYEILFVCLFAAVTVGYIQGMLLNGNMSVLDGVSQSWSLQKCFVNILIWLVLAGIVFIFKFKKREIMNKVIMVTSVWLILTQIVSLGFLIITSDATSNKSELTLTTNGMLEIGQEDNIFIFVLDKFDGTIMDELLEEDKSILEPLNDFVYYKNATSEFAPTTNCIPFLNTGTQYSEDTSDDYLSYAYEGNNLITQLNEKGYDIGLYTNKYFVSEDMKEYISNYEEGVNRTCNPWELTKLMMQCSRYRLAPFFLKNYYQYETTDIALLTVSDNIANIENDLPFYNRLINTGVHVSSDTEKKSTYKFFHMHGAHPPYIMTEDFEYLSYDYRRDKEHGGTQHSQARGALKIVYEYIKQLKELEKYEDSLIIITADHGYTNDLFDESGKVISTSFPILFVKEPYNKSDVMITSNAPVCHNDVVSTVKSYIGTNYNNDRTISEILEEENRIRFFKNVGGNEYLTKYEINGDVRDLASWKLLYQKRVK